MTADNATPTFAPGPRPRTVVDSRGAIREVPEGWELLPPGDAGVTRRVKAGGEFWVVQERRGRKIFSRGVWAPAVTIARVQAELAQERTTESYARRQQSAAARRERQQSEYVEDFRGAVVNFLAFHPVHASLAERLAEAVTLHATPVGSGTVARTKMIPVEERAEAAVIAWMRHQTTAYDSLRIPRIRGERREVRRMLAQQSRSLLQRYRAGESAPAHCPLLRALPEP
ncbi:MAG TPA: DUF2293 domain-containing protein [Planctomycetaceae bacterium]|nr:DUF2293 domain-containing protein [Planctomycetaceae bacterium]